MDRVLSEEKEEEQPLPVLRDDLQILPGAAQPNGAPSWVVFDSVANTYFEIGRELLDMLILWRAGTVEKLIRRLKSEFGRIVTKEEVGEAVHFLISNALIRDIPGNDFAMMAAKVEADKKSWFTTAMHSYLFFRIPLVRPDRFLQVTWPLVKPFFTRTAVWIYVVLGCLGLFLVSRQWDQFTGAFQYLLSWQGLVIYGFSLVFVKSLHELGHAYMAVRYGLRVPTIGVAFMVLMPVLYTDTSGAWRLTSRRQRLMIDGAGIFTELTLAAVATLLWAFLPDGPLRLCVFAVATTSWVTSLFVNLNPLMRFDGYYILSDTLGFQNLQNRGFEMAKWRLREILFGLGAPAPEPLSSRMRRTIVIHAWATWIYRFFLFLGIAVLVYAFFIKVIGILLFIVEILWFIAMPIWRELTHWWEIREKIMLSKRIYITGGVIASLVLLAIIPWSTSISVPAVMSAQQEQSIFAPFPSRIVGLTLKDGTVVKKGAILAKLDSPQLERDAKLANERASLLESRIGRTSADAEDRASLIVLTNELNQVREELQGLERLRQELIVRAPFDGVIVDVDSELHAGMWVNSKTPFAMVRSKSGVKIKGYVGEQNVFRFNTGATARFIPDAPELPAVDTTVTSIAEAASESLDEPYLALPYGGSIAMEEGEKERLRPVEAAYVVAMEPGNGVAMPQMAVRGVSVIEGEAQSFYTRIKRQVFKVLVREMGV